MPRGLRLDVLRGGSDATVTSEQPDLHDDEGFVFLGRMHVTWHGDGSASEDVDDGHGVVTSGVEDGSLRRCSRPAPMDDASSGGGDEEVHQCFP